VLDAQLCAEAAGVDALLRPVEHVRTAASPIARTATSSPLGGGEHVGDDLLAASVGTAIAVLAPSTFDQVRGARAKRAMEQLDRLMRTRSPVAPVRNPDPGFAK
jgi:hypothetical protein